MAEFYPTFLAGQRITASLLSSAQPQVVRKTSDTSRNSTTTRTADPHLTFEAVANAVYIVDGWIKWDGAANTADLSLQLTVPSGTLGDTTIWGTGNQVIGSTAAPALQINVSDARGYLVRSESLDVNAARSYGALAGGSPLALLFTGTLRISSTAGTVSLDWAQSSSDANNTTLYTDSWLRYQRIA